MECKITTFHLRVGLSSKNTILKTLFRKKRKSWGIDFTDCTSIGQHSKNPVNVVWEWPLRTTLSNRSRVSPNALISPRDFSMFSEDFCHAFSSWWIFVTNDLSLALPDTTVYAILSCQTTYNNRCITSEVRLFWDFAFQLKTDNVKSLFTFWFLCTGCVSITHYVINVAKDM